MLKKIIRTLVGSILLVASATPLMAEWNLDQQMRVEVPFAFSANEYDPMPAGKYTVSVHPDTRTIMMQGDRTDSTDIDDGPEGISNPVDRKKLVLSSTLSRLSLIEISTPGIYHGQTSP